MKVSVITILDNTNFGTYLQALALSCIIKTLGHEPEIVHYIRPSMTSVGHIKMIFKDLGVLHGFKGIINTYRLIHLRRKDYDFLSQYVPITQKYCSFEELNETPPVADIYMTGSDQVWNSIYNRGVDKALFLEYAPKSAKRVSYAASIGMDAFPSNEIVEVKTYLNKYNQITVREQAAKDILGKIGLSADVVLDPTLLLTNKEWGKIASDSPINVPEKYLLIYTVEGKNQKDLIEYYAIKVAERYNLKIYQVTYGEKKEKIRNVDRIFSRATPDVFLNLMRNASFVVVSSFHGTAFAINFNKQFLSISANRFNSRVENILNKTNLEDRLVVDKSYAIDALREIEYERVNALLSKERAKSLYLMNEILK